MRPPIAKPSVPLLWAVGLIGAALGPLLLGFEPVGGDPDRMYRPFKAELARALGEGRLPFWSDGLGLGLPLAAESHVGAFYPPNWLLYGGPLGVSRAYRWSMWLHYVAVAAATFAYARALGIVPWGATLAAVSFALGGFMAIHSSHEWSYQAAPYLVLALALAERCLAGGGGRAWPAALALTLGVQLTAGHFQVAHWTIGLVLATAAWRVVVDRAPARRGLAVAAAVGWGLAVAAVQLVLSGELAAFVGMAGRGRGDLAYHFPPQHWSEPIAPGLFRSIAGGPEAPYWIRLRTSGYEACLYAGTATWILACVGVVAGGVDRRVRPWLVAAPLAFALATMPAWWPEGYHAWLAVPGASFFRCPGRYAGLTGLGLALLAGAAFDRGRVGRRGFAAGLVLALASLAAAVAWASAWAGVPSNRSAWAGGRLETSLGMAALAWAASLGVLVAWRARRLGPAGPLVLVAVELTALFYTGTTEWGRPIPLPESSPALRALARARPEGPGRVAGVLANLPVWAGKAPVHPYFGMTIPPPDELITRANDRANAREPIAWRWLRRYGVEFGVWDVPVNDPIATVLYRGPDPALDRLAIGQAPGRFGRIWTVLAYPGAWRHARVARRVAVVRNRAELTRALAENDDPDLEVTLHADAPMPKSRRARKARVASWDGEQGVVEHDDTVDLVVNRTYYPGWTARVNDDPPQPVLRADDGLIAVRLEGPGPSRVDLDYRPTWLRAGLAVSAAATALALAVLAFGRAPGRPSMPPGSPGAGLAASEGRTRPDPDGPRHPGPTRAIP